jgi:hypothetical protein
MRTQKHGPDDYQWLADQCRQAARTASTEKERTDLLARAKTWDLLAERPTSSSSRFNE